MDAEARPRQLPSTRADGPSAEGGPQTGVGDPFGPWVPKDYAPGSDPGGRSP